MNKAELVDALAVHFEGNKAEAGRALKAVIDTITAQMAKGEKISITGFGAFETVHRSARMVRNPRTGERKEAPAVDVPRFRPGAELKTVVAGQAKPAAKSAAARTSAAKPAVKAAAKKAPAKKASAAKK